MNRYPPALGDATTGASPAPPRGIAAVAGAILWGCVAGALLGSQPLVSWAEANPDLPDWLVEGLRDWDAGLARLGLSELHPLLRITVEKAREQ
jgi:hypothetical protein